MPESNPTRNDADQPDLVPDECLEFDQPADTPETVDVSDTAGTPDPENSSIELAISLESASVRGNSKSTEPTDENQKSAIPGQPEIDLLRRQDEVMAGLDDLDGKIVQAIEALAAERKLELESHQQFEQQSQREKILSTEDFKDPQKSDQDEAQVQEDEQRKAA